MSQASCSAFCTASDKWSVRAGNEAARNEAARMISTLIVIIISRY